MDSDNKITINYSLSFREYLSMGCHFLLIKPLYLGASFIISFVLIGPSVMCSTFFQETCALFPWPTAYTKLVIGIVHNPALLYSLMLMLVFPVMWLLIVPLKMLCHYKNNSFLFENVSATVTPDGIISKTRVTESIFKWTSVHKITQNKLLIMMQITKIPPGVLCIPKRAFENPQKAEAFYNFVYENWKKASQ